MSNYAYLRVSTDQQDVANQRHGILEYSNGLSLTNLIFKEDTAPGKKHWKERSLGQMLEEAQPGDTLIFAEVSRMARSTLQVLEILQHCTDNEIAVHIAKQKMRFDGSMQAKITATVLGMAAEIEREFISMRTKEALAARKKNGMILGRPRGIAEKLKLDEKREVIQDLVNKGVSKRAISKVIECPASTLYDYVRKRKIKPEKVRYCSMNAD